MQPQHIAKEENLNHGMFSHTQIAAETQFGAPAAGGRQWQHQWQSMVPQSQLPGKHSEPTTQDK
jgi:hypothetical protein